MQLRLGYAWGEECRYFGPSEYRDVVIAGARSLLSNGVDVHVHIRTHPRFMDQWVDLLVSSIFRVMSLYFVFEFKVERGIGSSFWLTSLLESCRDHDQTPHGRFVESGPCGSGDSGISSPNDSHKIALALSSYTSDTRSPSVHIKNLIIYFSTHVQFTNERPYRPNSFKTSGHSRRSSSYIRFCRTDLLSSLSTASAKDIKCQG